MTDRIDWRHVPRWIRRSFDAILADFKVVDCGSLDVLLYCADDLDVSAPGNLELDRAL
ncbi:MAG: hypothetical protein WCD11_28870 [Solirubrobacteraceae bacterium]